MCKNRPSFSARCLVLGKRNSLRFSVAPAGAKQRESARITPAGVTLNFANSQFFDKDFIVGKHADFPGNLHGFLGDLAG